MTPAEALEVFQKFRDNGIVLLCAGRLPNWTFALQGRVVSASEEDIVIVSVDGRSGSIAFRLDAEDLTLRKLEPREFPSLLADDLAPNPNLTGIAVGLPLRLRPADFRSRTLDAPRRDTLFFIELPAENT